MPIYGDPEKIVQETLATARKEADSLLRRALALKERRLQKAREEAARLETHAEIKAQIQASQEKRRIFASKKLEAQRKILEKKEELAKRAFSQVMLKIEQLRKSESYPEIILRLTEEAVNALEAPVITVEFDKDDAHIFTPEFQADVSKRVPCQLRFKQGTVPGGGVIARSQRAIFNNSFPARLERLKGESREEILEILLGSDEAGEVR